MEHGFESLPPLKSALFVDFDNIFIGLSKSDPAAAERFAADPARWLSWLEAGMPSAGRDSSEPLRRRSILIRRCYPNPDAGFRRYRSFFTSAAFSVIDCPSLTRTGKNSSDIYMVMDILDTLGHKTHFDEFIIFSGDSDFMPVLLRLRAHDRRTTTLAIDFMPPAFKAACDFVIDEEDFIEDGLGVTPDEVSRGRAPAPVLKEMAERIYVAVQHEKEISGADLPDILKDFREFRESTNWLGFGTSQRLAEALIEQDQRLSLARVNSIQYKLVLNPAAPPQISPVTSQLPVKVPASETLEVEGEGTATLADDALLTSEAEELRRQVVAAVREVVGESRGPVLLARASQYVVSKLGARVLESQWAGVGSFKKLLQSIAELGLEITSQPEPGYIYDPRRHSHPARRAPRIQAGKPVQPEAGAPVSYTEVGGYPLQNEPEEPPDYHFEPAAVPYLPDGAEAYDGIPQSMGEFARRISQVTGTPLLSPDQYALVFRGIVFELQQIALGQKMYSTYQSSKAVSDWCTAQGSPISHSDIALVFKGIIFQDSIRFGKQPGSYTARELAEVVRDNILSLCERSRLELSEYDRQLLEQWLVGKLVEDALP